MPNVSKPKTTSAPRRKSPVAEASLRIARRERRRERSREEIIDAARRVLLRNGVAATTLDAIALEVGLTKAALYYYYPSKDALFFEIVFGAYESEARAIHDAVEATMDGGAALRAVVRATMNRFATRMDDFRIAYLQPQVGKPSTVRFTAEQFAKIRPLNDLAYAGATKKLVEHSSRVPGSAARIEPRLVTFVAHCAALGLLTMKGLVESMGDPLLYTDDQLIEGLAAILEAAVGASSPPAPVRHSSRRPARRR